MASTASTPSAEVEITADLVLALLAEQHPDLTGRPVRRAAEGWDNITYRLGDDLAVRLPRRALAAVLVEHEQRWLPRVAAHCPLPVPVPVRTGRPSPLFGWPWSVVPWFDGTPAASVPVPDRTAWAGQLADALTALHRPAPPDAPVSPVGRGGPLIDRTAVVLARIDAGIVDGLVPDSRDRARALWRDAESAPAWPGPPVWLHADPHPGNLLVHDHRPAALIDFGDLTSGDPACDLATAWLTFDAAGREAFRRRTDQQHNVDRTSGGWPTRERRNRAVPTLGATTSQPDPQEGRSGGSAVWTVVHDPGRWRRAAGWALSMATAMCAADPESDPVIAAIGRHAVRELLA